MGKGGSADRKKPTATCEICERNYPPNFNEKHVEKKHHSKSQDPGHLFKHCKWIVKKGDEDKHECQREVCPTCHRSYIVNTQHQCPPHLRAPAARRGRR